MIALLLDIAAAYFITRKLKLWRNWLSLALAAGAVIGLVATIATATLGSLPGNNPVRYTLASIVWNAAVCALNAWGFNRFLFRVRKP